MASDFTYCDRYYRSLVCLSVCLSVFLFVCQTVTFVHCAQTAEDIDTISFVATAPCLSKIVLKFSLYRSTPSSTNFAQKWPTRCRFERRRRSMSNYHRMVIEIVQWLGVQWTTYRKLPSLFSLYYRWPLRPPLSHKLGVASVQWAWATSRRVLPPGEYDKLLWHLLQVMPTLWLRTKLFSAW